MPTILILILVFYPRRTFLTWAGASLAGLVLYAARGSLLATKPQALEVTCLDEYGGLEGVMVTPENRHLVVSTGGAPPVGPARPGWGAAAGDLFTGGSSGAWTPPWPSG